MAHGAAAATTVRRVVTYRTWGTRRRRPKGSAFRFVVAAAIAALAVILLARPQDSANAGPVCIPGGTTVPVTADAKVSRVHPGRHYGHSGTWKINYAPANARTLLRFDLPTPPLQCTVTKATLKLTGKYSGTPSQPDTYPSADANMSVAKGHWTEAGVTWRNMPGGNACDGGTQDYAHPNSWDLTGAVQSAYQCLESGRLAAWNGIKVAGWSVKGRGASWKLVADSRESKHPPVVEISWG
jgi:hypothetical protein